MSDLISREDAMSKCKNAENELTDEAERKGIRVARFIIGEMPSAEYSKPLQTTLNSDLILREDAIEAFGLSEKTRKYGGDHSGYDTMMKYEIQDVLENLPSPEDKDRLYIKIYADDEPSIKAEKLYQICDKTQSREVAEWLKEYFPSFDAEWIPVSKQLPEQTNETQKRGWYLTTNKYGVVSEVCYEFYNEPFGHGWRSDMEIIAWKPKPKPYKESELEE